MIIIRKRNGQFIVMKHFTAFVLHSSIYKETFNKIFNNITWKPYHLEFMTNAETTSLCFFRTLRTEETGQILCPVEQANYQGEEILLLLERLQQLLDDNAENHQMITRLAVSTGIWIAARKGEIKELDLIVSGIASFANQSFLQQDLEELYEVSLRILYATDAYLKADHNKHDDQRPWRFLCLNHCIIATRTGNGELARLAYEHLIQHLPEEAEAFFTLGMRKVHAGQYSPHCQHLIQRYYERYCSDHQQQNEMSMTLN